MRKAMLWALGAGILVAAPLAAQAPFPPPFPPAPPVFPGPDLPPGPIADSAVVAMPPRGVMPNDNFRFWVRTDLLIWWAKEAPQPIAVLASPGDTNSVVPGQTNFGGIAGVRVAVGGWLDSYRNIGLEANFFSLGSSAHHVRVSSDDNGNPGLNIPFLNATPGTGGEFVLPLAVPGQFAGSVELTSTFEFWGTEANALFNLYRDQGVEWTLYAGFRYLNLQESLTMSASSSSLTGDAVTFLRDSFNTQNNFYGGQLGSRFAWRGDRLGLEATVKVALGSTQEIVDVQGSNAQFSGGALTAASAGGLFTQPSNIGHGTAYQFGVVPAADLKFSYYFSPWWRCYVGYDFLYWNQVARPGLQVDRNVNLSQSPLFGTGTLSGPASPAPQVNRTDFWVQGLTLGLEFRF